VLSRRGLQDQLSRMAVGPAVKSPRPVLLAIALDREAAVGPRPTSTGASGF
jgi:hypothetical protein